MHPFLELQPTPSHRAAANPGAKDRRGGVAAAAAGISRSLLLFSTTAAAAGRVNEEKVCRAKGEQGGVRVRRPSHLPSATARQAAEWG